jgi:hypothetical protein
MPFSAPGTPRARARLGRTRRTLLRSSVGAPLSTAIPHHKRLRTAVAGTLLVPEPKGLIIALPSWASLRLEHLLTTLLSRPVARLLRKVERTRRTKKGGQRVRVFVVQSDADEYAKRYVEDI